MQCRVGIRYRGWLYTSSPQERFKGEGRAGIIFNNQGLRHGDSLQKAQLYSYFLTKNFRTTGP
jgi:hypothetical protein